MKKLAMVLIVAAASFCLASSAFAADLAPGQSTKCNNASSITLENTGGGSIDRGEGNASIWKSSNFTTVPISLSPNANNGFPGNGGGAAGNAKVHMSSKHSMGAKKVVLSSQPAFSRGDSIGDISGLVKITNTGSIPVTVTCN
ncbi:MAG: hypothetical protein F3739_02595 [Nitrospinae bacterium]|nr:hypothetical protein [Nitrospinota bacterium]